MRALIKTTIALAGLAALSACGGGASEDSTGAAPSEAAVEPSVEVAFADVTGDPAAGEGAFGQCRACHSLADDGPGVGPTLYGVVGRPAGSVAGYNYSEANGSADVVWTDEVLFEYLGDPSGFLPGTRMMIPGIDDAQRRADLIAFLEANAAE
ncbi:cytochrome c family protein [uncultured Erythrobacter sp.]|uniref:c-type cytochrome n=1 Tax=uncultured Erythrobacter sp. TaxID=263913 RepID=UPI00261C7B87|nr:cytochrome c family protein [uncultured Erythrobacter sp.]